MTEPIHLELIEDNVDYAASIEISLEFVSSISLVKSYGAAESALRVWRTQKSLSQPEVILLDLNLPGRSGIEALPEIKKCLPDTAVLILTQSNYEPDVLAAIQAGASGYLLKSATRDQLIEAIQLVHRGGSPLDPKIAQYILKALQKKSKPDTEAYSLTSREIEVLRLIGEGLVKKEIAAALEISIHTVDNHTRSIYDKLNVYNAPAAISKAYQKGLFGDHTL